MSSVRPADYLGVVPARMGSKGIPHKNRQPLGGRPLVAHTLAAAAGARRLGRTVLSSDDPEVLAMAPSFERVVALARPAHLATDDASTLDVVRHVLETERASSGGVPRAVVLLQPTSPFRTAADIDGAIAAFEAGGARSLMSVCPVSQHPAECVSVGEGGTLEWLPVPRVSDAGGRQSYAPFFFIDGAIYICATDVFLASGVFVDRTTRLYVLPKSHGVDIDDAYELALARAMQRYAESEDPSLFTY